MACFSRATNRQVDNRNHTIVQGLSILTHYAQLRPGSPEVEYNFGRAYHQLGTLLTDPGLAHLAIPHYRRVLEMAEKCEKPAQGFCMAREAAFNLALLYASAGSPHESQALYRRWLVV